MVGVSTVRDLEHRIEMPVSLLPHRDVPAIGRPRSCKPEKAFRLGNDTVCLRSSRSVLMLGSRKAYWPRCQRRAMLLRTGRKEGSLKRHQKSQRTKLEFDSATPVFTSLRLSWLCRHLDSNTFGSKCPRVVRCSWPSHRHLLIELFRQEVCLVLAGLTEPWPSTLTPV